MADIRQTIKHFAFGTRPLSEVLQLEIPPFARTHEPHRQLEYISAYLKNLQCATGVIEEHYVDRDHIEDHGAFYARNFVSYENFCTRVHFFSIEDAALKRQFKYLVQLGKRERTAYHQACEEFSESAYLGSAVIKPLHGCPVGRTILRSYPTEAEAGKGYRRAFPCIRRHRAHLMGVELSVFGLPFQQQDTGVSACATTAIWSALHHFRGVEDVAAATPAQITNVASRYSLPFGRPMPSEGLSMEQMCQAIQGMGVSPHLHRTTDFATAQSIIYTATISGMAAILITQRDGPKGPERHAVTIAGMKLAEPFTPKPCEGIAEQSTQLVGAYVHDDRWGPYVATLLENGGGGGGLLRYLRRGVVKEEETWKVTHILIPMHSKIRLSFSGLQEVGMEVAKLIQWHFVKTDNTTEPDITLETSLMRGYRYVEDLLFEENGFNVTDVEDFTQNVSLPRYIGRVRVENPLFGTIDVLVDTTGTVRNLHCAAVVCRNSKAARAGEVGMFLAKQFKAFHRPFGISADHSIQPPK